MPNSTKDILLMPEAETLVLSTGELAALLTEAKHAHSELPADYPKHEWEEWYTRYITVFLRERNRADMPIVHAKLLIMDGHTHASLDSAEEAIAEEWERAF